MPRLLLIEDNQHMQHIYRERFRAEGFQVITADDGEQGIINAATERPDIILLDIMLPKLDGFAVLKRLKADEQLKQVPVFMLSNKTGFDEMQYAATLGARKFYPKGMAALQEIIVQIRRDCGFKMAVIVSRCNETAHALASLIHHPQLLCSTVTILAEAVSAADRRTPDLVVVDARGCFANMLAIFNRLKALPKLLHVPIVVVTDINQPITGATATVSGDQLADLRPLVLELAGLAAEPVPAAC